MLKAKFSESKIEAGCDEAGRGCLAGPVVAAAVILPADYRHDTLDDSKKLGVKQRESLKSDILNDAVSWAVAVVSPQEIDEINILNASFLAMERAVQQLKVIPELLLIDGNRFRTTLDIPYECIMQGDGKFLSIAAASILAKTYRDQLMNDLSLEFPAYKWEKNMGYPTKEHRAAIKAQGATVHHRHSFQLLPKQLELFQKS